jgi:hypothetical protein
MKILNLKYGFWTNYEQTVFLKHEKDRQGKWVLKLSNIIKSNTTSNLKLNPKADLRKSVSVRECMLYLICKTKRPLENMKARKNDEDILSAAVNIESDAISGSASQAKRRPSASAGDSIGHGRAFNSPAEPNRNHRDHVARIRTRAPGSGASRPPISESSRHGSHRIPPSPSSRMKTGIRSASTSQASSANNRKLSPDGRAKPPSHRGVPGTGKAAASPVRSSSSRGRARGVYQSPHVAEEDIESKDSNGVSNDEKDPPTRRAPVRPSHWDPPQPQSPPRRAGKAATAGASIPQEGQPEWDERHGPPPPAPTPPPAVPPPKRTGREEEEKEEEEEEEEEDYQQRPTARRHHRRSTRTQVQLPSTGGILRDLFRNHRYN